MNEDSNTRLSPQRVRAAKSLLSIAVIFIVVIGLYFIVRSLPIDALGEIRHRTIAWWSVPLVASLQVLFWLLASEIWRRVVHFSTGSNMTLWESYLQLAVVGIGKYVPGKVWGFVARAGDMYRQQIPIHLSLFSSIVEQVLAIAGAVIISLLAALIALPEYRLATTAVGLIVLIGTVGATTWIPAITHWLIRRRYHQNELPALPGLDIMSVTRFALAYALLWVLTGLVFSSIFFSLFDASITYENIAALVLANTAGIVLGFFAFFVPGGIGVREAIAAFVLAGFVPLREALLAAVCYRAWLILIDGFNALLILGREASGDRRVPAPGD